MTKVESRYHFTAPLDDRMLESIASAHGHYGIQGVKLTPSMDGLIVLWDASRLTLDDVDRTLHGFGLPVQRLEE